MSTKRPYLERKYQTIIAGILVSATILAGAFLSSAKVGADNGSAVDQIDIIVPASCTISGNGMDSHTDDVLNGQYSSDIGTTTLKAYCNDADGFAIYAIGFTGDKYDGEDHTKLIGASTNEKIVTGTATTAGNPDVSNWAMKLATNSSATYPITLDNNYGSYNVVPDTYIKVAHHDNATEVGESAIGTELTTTYAAYMSKTQPADTYVGKVKYTLIHPSDETPIQPHATQAGMICYYPNSGKVVGTMGCQSIADYESIADLLASNFNREGYGFAGWNDKFDYSGNFYGPNERITFTPGQYTGDNPGLSLYAVWVKSEGSLQDSSKVASLCGNGAGSLTPASASGASTLASVSALTDQRDNETYAIAKLADGNCWMIENLRLENTALHNSDGSLAQGYGTSSIYGNFSGLADAESDFSPLITANSLYSTDGSNNTINIGSSDQASNRMPRYNNLNTPEDPSNRPQNPTSNTFANDGTTVGLYSYGNYYTWSAAMANTIYYGGPNATDADGKTGDSVNTSICPSGWRLPYGGTDGSGATSGGFSYLDIQLGGTGTAQSDFGASRRWLKFPNNFIWSGYYASGTTYARGKSGWYWSSTPFDGGYSYLLSLTNFSVNPGGIDNPKSGGYAVRCVATQ